MKTKYLIPPPSFSFNPTHSTYTYRPDIDGLRALAVLLVLVFHAFPNVLQGGFIGVDVFFVISGFLITGIVLKELQQGTFSIVNFYIRRIRRIFPALLAVLYSVLLFGYLVLMTDELTSLGKHVFGGASFTANIWYWLEAGYWDVSAKFKPLLHLWSLGIEEQFYIVFPCFLLLAWQKKWHIFVLLLLICLLSLGANIYFHKSHPVLDFYAPFTRFWELLAGGLLAWRTHTKGVSVTNIHASLRNNISAILGCCLLWAATFSASPPGYFPLNNAFFAVMGTLCLITAGSQAWINRHIFSHKIAVNIGLISYPLYLWHWPLLSFVTILNGEYLGTWEWRFMRLGCLLIAFILAMATYVFIEKPIRFHKTAMMYKVYGCIALMCVVGAAGAYMYVAPNRPFAEKYEVLLSNLHYPISKDDAGIKYAPKGAKLAAIRFANADSSRTVAVIGDSHAQAAYQGIAEKNLPLGLNTFLLTYDWRSNDTDISREILVEKNDISHIFIFYRGMIYFSGNDIDGAINYPQALLEKFKPYLQNLIDIFNRVGKKVYIVSENPVFDKPARVFLPRPFNINFFSEKYPVMNKADVITHQKAYLEMLNTLKGATIIYSLDAFCPQNECRMFTKELSKNNID